MGYWDGRSIGFDACRTRPKGSFVRETSCLTVNCKLACDRVRFRRNMRAAVTAAFCILLFAGSAIADKPKTVDEAVQVLKTKWLRPQDRDWILRNSKEEVRSRLYMGFGTGMRNQFGLWGDNQSLRDSCATNDPEGCSVVILDRLWESVRGDADPALVQQLECQFHLVQAVHVSLKGFHQMTTRYMIRRLQSQIDSQLAALASSGVSGCQSALTLDVAGKPNMDCYIAAPHQKEERQLWDDLTLDQALAVLGTRNSFRTVNYPPKLTLDFVRPCQLPKPPY
jgi:hypothetical protein